MRAKNEFKSDIGICALYLKCDSTVLFCLDFRCQVLLLLKLERVREVWVKKHLTLFTTKKKSNIFFSRCDKPGRSLQWVFLIFIFSVKKRSGRVSLLLLFYGSLHRA